MEKFTGADITEMCCLCATAKYAIRGQVEADMEQQHAAEAAGHEYMEVVDEKFDDVSEINEEHFEMATSEARCSLSVAQRRGTILLGWQRRELLCFPGAGQWDWRPRQRETARTGSCLERDCRG